MKKRVQINVQEIMVKGLIEMRDISINLIDLAQNLYDRVLLLENRKEDKITPLQLEIARQYFGLK